MDQGYIKQNGDSNSINVINMVETENGCREVLAAIEAIHDALGCANWQMNFTPDGKMSTCIWADRFRKMLGYQGLGVCHLVWQASL